MTTYILMRRDQHGGYSTRGPLAQPLTRQEAEAEILRLKRDYPLVEHELFASCGTAEAKTEIALKLPPVAETRTLRRVP